MSEDLSSLSTNAYDWSAWDDTYAFIEDVNEGYLQSNLTNDTVDNDGLRLNLMLFANVSREIVYIKKYNLGENHEVPIPPQMIEDLIAPEIINPVFENKFVNGIVKNHSGFITAESKFGYGSTIKVFLPTVTNDLSCIC